MHIWLTDNTGVCMSVSMQSSVSTLKVSSLNRCSPCTDHTSSHKTTSTSLFTAARDGTSPSLSRAVRDGTSPSLSTAARDGTSPSLSRAVRDGTSPVPVPSRSSVPHRLLNDLRVASVASCGRSVWITYALVFDVAAKCSLTVVKWLL